MSQALLFSIGVGVFAMTIVGAMIFGRQAFSRAYEVQVADARNYANRPTAAMVTEVPGIVETPLVA